MNKGWDGGDISFRPETWARLATFLYPGAFGMAFAGSRGWHRMAVAIEDAGLIIHPTIFCWVFGSGFPKATRIDDQVDKMLGLEQKVIERVKASAATGGVYGDYAQEVNITEPASAEAATWVGHRYGLQAMKPMVEPIILFQKPYENKPVLDMMATGAGALNIDGARIGEETIVNPAGSLGSKGIYSKMERNASFTEADGRWPGNFCIVHTPECTPELCVCPDKMDREELFASGYWSYETYEQLYDSPLAAYFAKASQAERNAGLGHRETKKVGDGRPVPVDYPGQRGATERHNPHPTIKPIDLNKWLATLLLPPDYYAPRKLLVPFSGVGSEVIGALLAGWEAVDGIEMGEEFVQIARERLNWWMNISDQLNSTRIEAILEFSDRSKRKSGEDLQELPLFRGLSL